MDALSILVAQTDIVPKKLKLKRNSEANVQDECLVPISASSPRLRTMSEPNIATQESQDVDLNDRQDDSPCGLSDS